MNENMNKVRPKFSILMSAYNASKIINYAIQSVLIQKYDNYELIILENGSKDNTRTLLEEISKDNNKILLLCSDNNVGWAHGTSICLEHATGDYMIFLAADDMLFDEFVLSNVANEISEYNPDIVWVGNSVSRLNEGKYEIYSTLVPEHQVLDNRNVIGTTANIMQNVYYNSMFHFERISFLRDIGVDFYNGFVADCEGMTEAMCKADKMVVLDKVAYNLNTNTSQTSTGVGIRPFFIEQWRSIRKAVIDRGLYRFDDLQIIASRILANAYGWATNMCKIDSHVRDIDMQPVDVTDSDRLNIVLDAICSGEFQDMEYYSNEVYNKQEFVDELRALCNRLGESVENYYPASNGVEGTIDRLCRQADLAISIKSEGRTDYIAIVRECIGLYEKVKIHLSDEDSKEVALLLKSIC